MAAAHFDESLGDVPVRNEVVYSEEGVLVLEDFRQEWFLADKLVWEEIEVKYTDSVRE